MTPTNSAEKVVAEWRDAMEGVPDGEIERAFIVDGYGEAIQGEAVLYLPDDNEAEFRGAHAEVISAWFERCSPSGISGLLDRLTAAEARVTALEAEAAGLREALTRIVGTAANTGGHGSGRWHNVCLGIARAALSPRMEAET
jgi:hypothetical protein